MNNLIQESVKRKLAAVVALDVVSYSKLMSANEVGTLKVVKEIRSQIIEPTSINYGGRVFKSMGDGFLLEFGSAVDAVGCTFSIQRQLGESHVGEVLNAKIFMRAGINLGDVILDGDDIFGDGVNIAARLEPLAEPGGICISGAVYDHVKGKLPYQFEFVGERSVKNIDTPIRVYALNPSQIAGGKDIPFPSHFYRKKRNYYLTFISLLSILAASAAILYSLEKHENHAQPVPIATKSDTRISVAVLPFESESQKNPDSHFADELTEDVIIALSRFSDLKVVARNAVLSYKGKSPRPEEVGRDLNVKFMLGGTIRSQQENARITVRLVSTADDSLLWTRQFNFKTQDISTIHDQITQQIAGLLVKELSSIQKATADSKPPANLEAHDLVLKGRSLISKVIRSSNSQARSLFERAIQLDPGYAPGYVGLGQVELNSVTDGWTPEPQATLEHAEALGRKAIEIDPTVPGGYTLLGNVYVRFADYDRAIDAMQRAVNLNDSDSEAFAGLGTALLWNGDLNGAIEAFETAERIGPNFSVTDMMTVGAALLLAGRTDDSIKVLERALEHNDSHSYTRAVLAAAYFAKGRQTDAAREAAAVGQLNPNFSRSEFGSLLRNRDQKEKLIRLLRKAGL